jgi:hypothetical protein
MFMVRSVSLRFVLLGLLLGASTARAQEPATPPAAESASAPAAEPAPPAAAEPAPPAVAEPAPPAAAKPAPTEPAPPEEEPEEEPTSSLTALYPLWENTGHIVGHRRLFLGTSNAEFGLFDTVQIGVHPLFYLFRTLNLHGKVRLLSRDRLSVAAHAELLHFLPGASEAFISSNYVSRIDTRDVRLTVIPVGTSASYAVTPWFYLHGTATVAGIFDNGPFQERLVLGTTVVAEVLALRRHSLALHAGEVGFWNHDFATLGGSYRYRLDWFELKLGYFFRFLDDGRQGSPLVSLGAYL